MRLIIGGAFQGKYEYAKETYPKAFIINEIHTLIREDVRRRVCKIQNPDGIRPDAGYVTLQRELEESWYQKTQEWICQYPDLCLICDEVGMGIVPMEKWERIYREVVGHICIRLAKEADSVERIVGGISLRIKG